MDEPRGRIQATLDLFGHELRLLPWRSTLSSFVLARLIVVSGVLVARRLGSHNYRFDGPLGWDAYWYRLIADHGYSQVPGEAIRFFPLLPLAVRALADPLGGNSALALLLISNGAAIAYPLLASRLARDAGALEREVELVPWVIAFAPAGFVLVMGYTESTYGVLVCVVLLCGRRNHWSGVAGAGFLAGLLRPTGILLMIPILIEVVRSGSKRTVRELVLRAAAVLAPLSGLAVYLGWSAYSNGDLLRPLRAQTAPGLRGGVVINPGRWIVHAVQKLTVGDLKHAAPLMHLLWAVVALVLLALAARRLPVSYTAFAAVSLLAALTARNMASFERYGASALPLLLVVPSLLSTARLRKSALLVATAILFVYSFAAFSARYIP
ncbi:MAG: hypothetical protein JWM76_64 [Pseudonocardiales bacterium]|nr:hypothetical protein [Pseudonocardiales bacterium]